MSREEVEDRRRGGRREEDWRRRKRRGEMGQRGEREEVEGRG